MAEKVIFADLGISDDMFLSALSSEVERLHNRHTDSPKEFFPEDFVDEMDEARRTGSFIAEDAPLPEEIISSLYVNLLTEEGLPYYTTVLDRGLPKKHPFREWLYQWTAEEGRHAPTIRGWLHRTKQIDMHMVERSRMKMMINPDTPQPESFIESIVYPAFQEPATEISHRNTMRLLPTVHKIGKKALGAVVGDEKKHGLFYTDLTESALAVDPSRTVIAIYKQVVGFAMPGKSIPGFDEHKKTIEKAGIFGPVQLKKIYDDLITDKWKIWDKTGLDSQAEIARDYLREYLEKLGRAIEWSQRKRTEKFNKI